MIALSFSRSQNVLDQSKFFGSELTKNWVPLPNIFVTALKLNLLNANHLLVWHKKFGTGTVWVNQFWSDTKNLDKHKIFWDLNALSFYRSQNILGSSKFIVPDQILIYILCQSQSYCARPKDDFYSANLVYCASTKYFWVALNPIHFLV